MTDKKAPETYVEVAKAEGLNDDATKRFIYYMNQRWAGSERIKCVTGYASEWADRFKRKCEYQCSDKDGQIILDTMEVLKI